MDDADPAMEAGVEPVCDFVSGEVAGMSDIQGLTQGNGLIPHLRRPQCLVTGRLRRESIFKLKCRLHTFSD
ncbi:hypothetical protein UR09_05745 [Candidatus Nitromaritima sp. SCGC AAA799-A02]|nr:hypothetical protein UR09_05745 [Candidatus Nitromaritima sp. SCGC AAA799-A02]